MYMNIFTYTHTCGHVYVEPVVEKGAKGLTTERFHGHGPWRMGHGHGPRVMGGLYRSTVLMVRED